MQPRYARRVSGSPTTSNRFPLSAACVVGLATLLVVAGVSAGVASANDARAPTAPHSTDVAEVPASPGQSASRTIELTQRLQLTPRTPGEITVRLSYAIPDDVVELKTRVPSGATVTSTNGFVKREGQDYAWDQQTSTPTVTYRVSVNETHDVTGPIAGKGDYVFVDPGPWALVRVPPTATGWSWRGGGTVGLTRSTTTAGPGATSEAIAFLGDHREVTRTAHGQTVRLVIPAQASLAESPARILDSMASASNALQVGDRDDRVFVVAAPTERVRWGVRGLQTGNADMWVRDGERLDTADNVWIHEYVHSRQGYAAAREVRWFTEASAAYYAALLTLQQDRIGFAAFRDRLALGTRSPDRSAVLADPATWDTVAPYTKGALVAGELDRQLRLATTRRRSFQDVFGRMNSHPDAVTGPAFGEMVRATGDESTATLADRYTSTREGPSMWDQSSHGQAFNTTPAQIGYAFPSPETPAGFRVSGPYRQGPVGCECPIRLATGETLTVDVQVSNTGGTTGEYDAQLLVNGDPRERQTGRIEAGTSRTLTFTHQFTEAGEYTLAVGGETVGVSVRLPSTPTVTGLDANLTHRAAGRHDASVTVTVRNGDDFPAADTLTLFHNGEPIETRRVELAPGGERTVSFEATTVGPGNHVFRVGDRTATVTVEGQTTPAKTPVRSPDAETTAANGDGFGITTVLITLVGLILTLGRYH